MHLTSEQLLVDGVLERRFVLDGIPGILWTSDSSAPVPLVLLAHPGGLEGLHPRLLARARRLIDAGFAAATIELPGSGDRPRSPVAEQARTDLRRALAAGQPVADIVDRLVLPLVEQSVPEWRSALDALLALPGLRGPIGYAGGVVAIGVRLALTEPRIAAAGFFAGSFVPAVSLEEARGITLPVHVLLQWDDENNDRGRALELFDAFASTEKTLYASLGGHTGVPEWAGDDAVPFFERHLR